jgi:hypothetical protein
VIPVNGHPTLTHALPSEYLERLLLANRIFDDEIRLLGITREPEGLVIVTAQPTIVGRACDADEMIAWFDARRFVPLQDLHIGHRGALSFYRDIDQVAVFDAHPANFLRDRSGVILPIDAMVLRADQELADMLQSLA